jgi:peptide methionine sulfoxide reductase msrA/msrB
MDNKFNELNAEEKRVILDKGTERAFTGKYDNFWTEGEYTCKQCGAALYKSSSKFDGHCGWPAFDDEIAGAVTRHPDPDGRRVEIVCTNCSGHLGHVFAGEGFTAKNTRHCVNSISLNFVPATVKDKVLQKAYFAGGCFWGVEYYFERAKGVTDTEVGYMGGTKEFPTYQEVCAHTTGHFEAIEVTYDPSITNYEAMAKMFFETHDPTQTNGQGPDLGEQYLSVAFYTTPEEKATLQKLIGVLEAKGMKIATKLIPATKFWKAEEYHQRYYDKTKKTPYCHAYKKLF